MCHVPSVHPRAPAQQHGNLLIVYFWEFTNIWVGLDLSYSLHLICNSKSYKHSGLFLSNLLFLWFLTLVIVIVKPVNLPIQVKVVYKAPLNKSINTQIS